MMRADIVYLPNGQGCGTIVQGFTELQLLSYHLSQYTKNPHLQWKDKDSKEDDQNQTDNVALKGNGETGEISEQGNRNRVILIKRSQHRKFRYHTQIKDMVKKATENHGLVFTEWKVCFSSSGNHFVLNDERLLKIFYSFMTNYLILIILCLQR